MHNYLKYLFWTVIIGGLLFLGVRFEERLFEEASRTFELLPAVAFSTIFPVIIGLFLNVPTFIRKFGESGVWRVDWAKLIIIGLPTFYVTFVPLLSFTFLGQYLPYGREIIIMDVSTITGMILGYVLLDCVIKIEKTYGRYLNRM